MWLVYQRFYQAAFDVINAETNPTRSGDRVRDCGRGVKGIGMGPNTNRVRVRYLLYAHDCSAKIKFRQEDVC
jgi:hypothetical protein